MKALPIIFLVFINYVIAENDVKYELKRYPKKVKPNENGPILIKSGIFLKTKEPQLNPHQGYTAFQGVGNSKVTYGIPESLYFPVENPSESKPRMKKVLNDHNWAVTIRHKRSVEGDKKQETDKTSKTSNVEPNEGTKIKNGDSNDDKSKTKNEDKVDKEKKSGQEKGASKSNANDKAKETKKDKQKKSKDNKKPVKVNSKKNDSKNQKMKATRKPVNENKNAGKPKGGRRLVSALEAVIEDFPYVVSIQKNRQHWCSGALLNPTLVITTANCVWKSKSFSRMTIRAGSTLTNEGGQTSDIVEVMKHPDWGIRKTPDCDVALLLLGRRLKFSNSIHGVDLPNRLMMPAFDDVWVTSWGAARRDGIYDATATSLQVYHARLMNHEKCNNITERFLVTVTENFICLAQSGRHSPCTRDTGAPAVSDGILWGLASWGLRKLCGTERYPAMFSYLASNSNLDFLTNATTYLMSEKRYYPYGDRRPSLSAPIPVYTREREKGGMNEELAGYD